MKRLNTLLLIGLVCCMLTGKSFSQSITLPTYLETLIGTAGDQIYTFNSDILELPNGRTVQAIVCDPYTGPKSGVYIHIWDYTGASADIHIPSGGDARGEAQPDIVLGNSVSNPNVYSLTVVYLDTNQYAHLRSYWLYGVGTGAIATPSMYANGAVSPHPANYPHIDMVPDYTTIISGLPVMHRFAISYMHNDNPPPLPTTTTLVERNGDNANPTLLSPLFPIVAGPFSNGADIAMSYDPNTQLNHVYMTATKINTLVQAEVTLNAMAPGNATPGGLVVNTLTPPAGYSNFLLPRIEAMGINTLGSTSITPWVIGTLLYNTTAGVQQVLEYNPKTSSWILCSTGPLSKVDNFGVCVAAGSGFPDGNICNKNYNIGWYSTYPRTGYLTRVIDATTGLISTAAPNFYVANQNTILIAGLKYSIGLTSCSNSGNNLLTSWFDNTSGYNIWYKLKPGITGYRPAPTGTDDIAQGHLSISPNPAHDNFEIRLDKPIDKFTIKVTAVDGRTALVQQASGKNATVDISKLASGTYFVEISGEMSKVMQQLVKE